MADPPEALVIAAHGSHRNPHADETAFAHADTIRDRGIFDEVRATFWKEEPSFREVLRTLDSSRVFVVPLFMSEGYFTDRIVPRELRVADEGGLDVEKDVTITDPVGTHPTMADVIVHRATECIGEAGNGDATALAVIGHGTGRHDRSAESTNDHVEAIRERNRFAEVHSYFLDEPPFVTEVTATVDSRNIVAVPLFVADGYHTTRDIPNELGLSPGILDEASLPATVDGRRVWYTSAVGTDPRMVDVIFERAAAAGASIDSSTGGRSAGSPARSFDQQLDVMVESAEGSIDCDGVALSSNEGTYEVSTPETWATGLDEDAARAFLADYPTYVTNWYYWNRVVGTLSPAPYAFARWLEHTSTVNPPRRYEVGAEGIEREWGELLVVTSIDPDGRRFHEVRHVADRGLPARALESHEAARSAREIAKYDERGDYRPLKSAPTVQQGWQFSELTAAEVVAVVEHCYPATIANWHRECEGRLDVTPWNETADRQTGRYENVDTLDHDGVEELAATCCVDGACLKRRTWDFDKDRELAVPRGDGTMPCREPCSVVLERARERIGE